jgi:hypothetical protein
MPVINARVDCTATIIDERRVSTQSGSSHYRRLMPRGGMPPMRPPLRAARLHRAHDARCASPVSRWAGLTAKRLNVTVSGFNTT